MTTTQTGSPNLDALDAALSALDPTGAYRGISYNLTPHNTLAEKWWVFMPYGTWQTPPKLPAKGPLQDAIAEAIADVGPPPRQPCYIDILHLNDQGTGTSLFFNPIIENIIEFIKSGVTPVIRYLVGETNLRQPQESGFIKKLYESGRISEHTGVFYGSFAPSFQSGGQGDDFAQDGLVEAVHSSIAKALPAGYQAEAERLFAALPDLATLPQLVLPPMSWNHAKIFALNGSRLVTGGANYWQEYSQGESVLFDVSARIFGDAAIDAHKYANYLWMYLSNIPATDTRSFSFGNTTSDPTKFDPSIKAPLLTDFPTNPGTTRVLTANRIGNWPSQTGYPVQVIDGIRDFIINVIAVLAEKNGSDELTVLAVNAAGDENLRHELSNLGISINPAAWASRYARNHAISQAQSNLRLSQQALVMDDLVRFGPPGYQELVTRINETLGTSWNGYIWPFDTLCALGSALATFSQNPNIPGKVQIVCSAPSNATGYEDSVEPAVFRQRLASIMTGMSELGYIKPVGSISEIVSKRVEYRRVDNTPGNPDPPPHANHAKLVVVDDALCYVGSDDLYPAYCEESGVWIDDQQAIQEFVDEYWTGLWNFAVPVT